MCTDCQARPDITVAFGPEDFDLTSRSELGNTYLAQVFANFDGDLSWTDATHIIANARAAGLVVEVR